MIDLNPPVDTLSERINAQIDRALELEESFQPARNYLGGSRIGAFCERALQYEFTQTPKDPGKDFSGRLLRIFARGHWVESRMVDWLRLAGFGLVAGPKDGGQFGFEAHDGYVGGHLDGILVSGPDEHGPWPRLWENKALGQKYFLATKRHGIRSENPTYFAQCQYYMEKFNLMENPALFSVVNANDMDIYWESIPYDAGYVSMLDAKAARILQSCREGVLLPRASQDPGYFRCKMCDYRERCFSNR